MHGETVKFSS